MCFSKKKQGWETHMGLDIIIMIIGMLEMHKQESV